MSDYPAIPFPDELVHLEQVSARLSDALQQAEASVRRADREYADTKKYMADHRGEIDPHEMFQNELLLKQTDRTGAFAVEMRDRIAKLKDSPYFARIDFREEQEEEGQPYYIGRFAFQYENEPLVFDWRAPISGKFPGLTEPNASYHGIRFAQDVGAAAFVTRIRAILLRDTGATLSPFHGFLFLQGLETLSLRVERHVENALKVVEYLKAHPQVEEVHHPSVSQDPIQQQLYKKYFPRGGGSIFTFEIRGGAEKAREFIDNLELFSLLANVADVKSLVIHPASTTHSQMNEKELLEQGIRPGTIRLSIGTEHIDDILEDLEEAFRSVL